MSNEVQWLVSGVGRSGTTALYSFLYDFCSRAMNGMKYIYEPHLWGATIWDTHPKDLSAESFTTDALNIEGIFAHINTPLFASNRSEIHYQFLSKLFDTQAPTLCKMIRNSGRLESIITSVPTIQVVHIVRNPLDCVNSVLPNFSYYGDDFHPSDRSRFCQEVATKYSVQLSLKETEAFSAVQWWRYMNQAAIATALRFPDRVSILPWENLVVDPRFSIESVIRRLGYEAPFDLSTLAIANEQVGKNIYLGLDDLQQLEEDHSLYFDSIEKWSSFPLQFDVEAWSSKCLTKFRSASDGGTYTSPVNRNKTTPQLLSAIESERGMITYLENIIRVYRTDIETLKNRVNELQAKEDEFESFKRSRSKLAGALLKALGDKLL